MKRERVDKAKDYQRGFSLTETQFKWFKWENGTVTINNASVPQIKKMYEKKLSF